MKRMMGMALLLGALLLMEGVAFAQRISTGVSMDYSIMNVVQTTERGNRIKSGNQFPQLTLMMEYGFSESLSLAASASLTDWNLFAPKEEPSAPTISLFLAPQYTVKIGDKMHFAAAAGPGIYDCFALDGDSRKTQLYSALTGRARLGRDIGKNSSMFIAGKYNHFLLYPKAIADMEGSFKMSGVDISIGYLRSF